MSECYDTQLEPSGHRKSVAGVYINFKIYGEIRLFEQFIFCLAETMLCSSYKDQEVKYIHGDSSCFS